MDLNKGISTPIAILLIITVSAVVGVLVWQLTKPAEQPTPKQASDYTTQSACEEADYYWYNEACHEKQQEAQVTDEEEEGKRTAENVEVPIEEPYESFKLGEILSSETTLTLLKAELGLTDSQKDFLSEIENEINKPASSPMEHTAPPIEGVDSKIKKELSPLQYVLFRDWVVQHWEMSRGVSTNKLAKMNNYTVDFIKSRLSLSEETSQRISDILFQHKKETLQHWSQLNLGKEPQEIAPQIKDTKEKMFENMVSELTLQQKEVFQELK